MTEIKFQRATTKTSFLRLSLAGPPKSGKTYSALQIATGIGKRIAVVDTEHGSASKYAREFAFDVINLEQFSPENYMNMIHAASTAGYDVLILDSLSHEWFGQGGALELVDQATAKQKTPNSYTAWRDVTPIHNRLIDTIIRANLHIIGTLRTKTDYVIEKDQNGKTRIRKVGLAPIQREGMEYEFDIIADMDLDHNMIVSGSRYSAFDGKVINRPTPDVGRELLAWLREGKEVAKTPEIKLATPPVNLPEEKPETMGETLVQGLSSEPANEANPQMITVGQMTLVATLCTRLGCETKEDWQALVKKYLGIVVDTRKDLRAGQAENLIGKLRNELKAREAGQKEV